VIHLRVEAPALPAPGAPCNGCGVCCASEPCPLGMLVSGRRQGRCRALRWDGAQRQYRCSMLTQPQRLLRWWPGALAPWLARWSRRWIASGSGCDALLQTTPPPAR
jgi:hypothetical protein